MNAMKKARRTMLALIAALCLMSGMLLGGGYAFAKAEDGAQAPAAKTVALTPIDNVLVETKDLGEPDASNWAAAYPYRHFYDGAAHTLTVTFAEEIDTSVYAYAEFRALAWSASGYTMGVSKEGGEVIDTFSVNGECGITDYHLARQKLTMFLAPYADANGKVNKIVLHLPAYATHAGFSGYFLLNQFTCYPDAGDFAERKTLNVNGVQADVLACNELKDGNFANLFMTADDGSKVQYVSFDNADNGTSIISFGSGYKYKASVFDYLEIVFCINSNTAGGSVTAEFFADGDTEHAVATASAASGDNVLRRIRIPSRLLADKYGYVKQFTVKRKGVNDGGGMLFFHNVDLVKGVLPETHMNSGVLDYAGGCAGGSVPAWGTAFDYKKMGIDAQTVDIGFATPIDTSKQYAATFNALLWQSADGTLQVKNASGEVIDRVAVRGHENPAALDQNTTVSIRLSDYAGNDGKVSGIQLAVEGGGSHLLFTDLTCYEIPNDAAGKISAPLSKLYPVHTRDDWKEYFAFETKQDAGPKSFTVEFIEPIEITHKYAVFNAMFWGGSTWKNVTVSANGNVGASEKVWIVQGYEDGYGSEKVLLPLEKFKTGDSMLHSITLGCDTLGSDDYQGFLLISELEFTDTPPADLVIDLGDIDYRTSGLGKAHTVPAWADVFAYEKMNALGQEIELSFYDPIDVTAYKYAEFDMLLWTKTNWYDITVKNGDKNTTVLVPAYESMGVVDTRVGLSLASLAGADGKIQSLTFVMPSDCGTYVDKDGETQKYDVHFLVTDFTLSAEVPADAIPKPGDIDYKRSGLIKTSASSPIAFWGDVFDYQANVEKGDKLTVKFAEPIDANETQYAVFNALLWGIPDFIDVPVTTSDGSATLSVYSYWAETVGEINASNMLAKLELKGLADKDGKIRELTFDFANLREVGDDYSGWFLFENFNCVNMKVGTVKSEKDIASVMPIGDGKTFTASAEGEAGTWSKHATARTEAYDAIEFSLNATYTEHFTFGMLVRTLRPGDHVSKGGRFDGVLIELTDTYASVRVWNGDDLLSSVKNGSFFASGEKGNVKLEISETTLLDTPCGYTLRLTVGDTVLDGLYIDLGAVTFGYYTHILTANGQAFTADVSSASETPVSAADFMNVQLVAASADGKTKRVPLEFTYSDIGNTEMGAPVINGVAHWDATGKYVVFDGEGEVTVQYSVTNDFGTFTSNVLTLTYTAPENNAKVPQSKGGCGGAMGVSCLWAAIALLFTIAAMVSIRKKMHRKEIKK